MSFSSCLARNLHCPCVVQRLFFALWKSSRQGPRQNLTPGGSPCRLIPESCSAPFPEHRSRCLEMPLTMLSSWRSRWRRVRAHDDLELAFTLPRNTQRLRKAPFYSTGNCPFSGISIWYLSRRSEWYKVGHLQTSNTFPLTRRLKRLRILDSLGSAGSAEIWLVNDRMKTPRFSSIELKAQGMARRKANHQLLRVPWGTFRRAYEEYPRWQALALWGELVVGMGACGQSYLLATLNKHCRGFVAGRSRLRRSEPLALNLTSTAVEVISCKKPGSF